MEKNDINNEYLCQNTLKKIMKKGARSHPRLRKNESRLLAPATTTTTRKTTAILKSPFRTS